MIYFDYFSLFFFVKILFFLRILKRKLERDWKRERTGDRKNGAIVFFGSLEPKFTIHKT